MAPEEEQPPSPGATVAAAPTKAAQQHSADDVGASTARMAKEAGSRHQFANGRPTISAQRTTSGGSVTPWPAERASRQHRTGTARATVREQRARAPRAPFASPLPYDTSGLRSYRLSVPRRAGEAANARRGFRVALQHAGAGHLTHGAVESWHKRQRLGRRMPYLELPACHPSAKCESRSRYASPVSRVPQNSLPHFPQKPRCAICARRRMAITAPA